MMEKVANMFRVRVFALIVTIFNLHDSITYFLWENGRQLEDES
jgi:hypothetical protein